MKNMPFVTFGELAKKLAGTGLQTWQIRRLFERKLLPESMAPRIAGARVIPKGEVRKVVAMLKKHKYIRSENMS